MFFLGGGKLCSYVHEEYLLFCTYTSYCVLTIYNVDGPPRHISGMYEVTFYIYTMFKKNMFCLASTFFCVDLVMLS